MQALIDGPADFQAFVYLHLFLDAMPYVWVPPESQAGAKHKWRGRWEPLSSHGWSNACDGEWQYVGPKKNRKQLAASRPADGVPPTRESPNSGAAASKDKPKNQNQHRTFLQVVLDADTESEIRDKQIERDKKKAELSDKEARAERIQRALEALGEEDAESDLRQVLLHALDKAQASTSEKKKKVELDAKKAYCARETARLLELNASISKAQKALELRNDALLVEQKTVETLEKELSIAPPPSVPPQLEQEVEVLRTFLREGLAQDSLDWTSAAKKVQEAIAQITADAEEPIRKKQKPEGTAGAVPAS